MDSISVADFNSFIHQQLINHSQLDQRIHEIIELLSVNLSIDATHIKQEDLRSIFKGLSKIAKEANASNLTLVARLNEYHSFESTQP